MGCDIHPHIEYFDVNDPGWINCFAQNVDIGRNYTLFNALAGVRGMGDCVVDPRGLPDPQDLSIEVFSDFYCRIVDVIPEKQSPWGYSRFDCGLITKEEATRYINQYNNIKEIKHKGECYIPCPDYHTPSHLFLNEMISVRRKYLLDFMDMENPYRGKKRKEIVSKLRTADDYELMKCCFSEIESPSLNAVIGSMIAIENSGPYKSRFVFWFDS